jgi:hypothetical protein
MRHCVFSIVVLAGLLQVISSPATAQTWNFIKEKDGIKIYTSQEPGKSLKAYRGVTDIHAPAEKIFAMIEDVYHTDWWDKNISQIKVLRYEKYKKAQYYLIYDLPWPVTDRDLCVDVTASVDPVTGERRLTAVPLTGVIPEGKDMVRIREYRQTWTLDPAGKDKTHVVLEGYVDPAGTIPDWISNMLIVDSPVKVISEVKQRMERP